VQYNLVRPCDDCPFLKKHTKGYTMEQLKGFSSGEFPCHKTSDQDDEGNFTDSETASHCAGALIFLEKRHQPHQMMRICERLNMYDASKLDMKAKVR
jgi:hypothetical protein